jgi:hypothetical protein
MKRLFIILGLIGVIQVSSGFKTAAKLPNPKKEVSDSYSGDLLSQVTPVFTQVDGNLFLAIKTEDQINVEDGDVVEFVFNKRKRIISFHVNEINQELINTEDASLFVMVHNDLALTLKSNRLKQITITHNNEVYSLPVNKFWIPHQYLTSL